ALTVASMLLVTAVYLNRDAVADLLNWFRENAIEPILPAAGGGRLIFSLVNFGLIVGLFASSVLRVIRLARGKPPIPSRPQEQLTMEELISGELIAGAALAGFLALVLRAPVLQFFVDHVMTPIVASPPGASLPTPDDCTVTLAPFPCHHG